MHRVKIYSTASCPRCSKAKELMTKWQITYQEIMVDNDRAGLKEMFQLTNGARTVPQISIDEKWIGGLAELTELHMDGELDKLMA